MTCRPILLAAFLLAGFFPMPGAHPMPAAAGRMRASINEDWRFIKGDSQGFAGTTVIRAGRER